MDKHLPDSANDKTEFTPPRHWIGLEELDSSYWSDPKVREKRGQEFFEKPVELIDQIDRSDKEGLARRDFLTIMGASMAMASFACARRPVNKIIPYVVAPEEITPGVPAWYASTYNDGYQSYGVLVKTREGRPIKLEGNPEHPVNMGKLSARAQAAILDLYDTDRLQGPLMRARSSGSRQQLSWHEADSTISAHLAKGASKVRILTGAVQGESTRRLIREFLAAYSGGQHVEYEPLALEEISEAQASSYGTAVTPHYRFDQADVIVSLGADFLGTWLSPVEYMAQWVKNRKLDSTAAAASKLSKMYCFENIFSITGANADERIPVRPGDELKIGLAIAHELVVAGKRSSYASDSAVTHLLAGYKPEAVAHEIGWEEGAAKIKKIAEELWAARGKSLVVGGGVHTRTRGALALQVVVNFLNSVLDNEGSTVDGNANATLPRQGFSQLAKLVQDMNAGNVEVLIIHRSNPAFQLAKNVLSFEDALKKVPLVIAISDRLDETAMLADFVLPDHHFLENWGDAHPRPGVYTLQQPALAPMYDTRSFQDSLLAWMKSTNKASGLASRIVGAPEGSNTWYDYLKANWQETVAHEYGAGNFDRFWEGVLRTGLFDGKAAKGGTSRGTARAFRVASLTGIPTYSPSAVNSVLLSLYENVGMGDGRHANNPWLQEFPDPISSVTWDNFLSVGPTLAKKLDVRTDDVVELKAGGTSLELPVYVQPGMHPMSAAVAVGWGRRAAGKVGNQAGVDVYPLMQMDQGRALMAGLPVTVIRKTGRVYRLAMTQWHTASENRPVINDISLADFKQNPGTANHTDPHLRLDTVPTMWPLHNFKGYRWGMSIDLNSCTGCGACMIACVAENNVPVVGRDQVRNARNMHWIRIDRYYSGSPENPDVVLQPMLCQHCENAPCETVCPVLATIHDDEGLNIQVYNRCVGTRYCQNNCPYKVRRFNFFDHWKSYEGSMNLAWNPDVTVRTRGIMEKCTFCVQRIRESKDQAKDRGVKVKDGELKTACQQTCPTDAIIFGDINDPSTLVSKLRADQRSYRVLEVLNTKPSISYLSKVRNKEMAHHEHGGEGKEHHNG